MYATGWAGIPRCLTGAQGGVYTDFNKGSRKVSLIPLPDPATAMGAALGRIFRLASRPTQPGDVQQYEEARRVALVAADQLGISREPEFRNCWQRDRLCGAQGD